MDKTNSSQTHGSTLASLKKKYLHIGCLPTEEKRKYPALQTALPKLNECELNSSET